MHKPSVIIEGGESREHALAYAVTQCDAKAYVDAPNAGTVGPGYINKRPDNPDLIIIGPEAPLIDGRTDQLEALGHTVLGVNHETAFLEGLKIEAGEAMIDFDILHPPWKAVRENLAYGKSLFRGRRADELVLKAQRICRGQGVTTPKNQKEAFKVMSDMISGRILDGAGKEFQVQDKWHGPEVSVFTVADNKGNYYKFPIAIQDHKRLLDGDKGPNTGGTGAYGPVSSSILHDWQWGKIDEAIDKTYAGLKRRGLSTQGFLFFGFMLAEEAGGAPALIEWNVRLGSPEAQILLPLMIEYRIDIYDLFYSAASGNLRPEDYSVPLYKLLGNAALAVNMMPSGYPDEPVHDAEIKGLNEDYENVLLFHGKTRKQGKKVIAPSNRGLTVVGLGADIEEASENTYKAIKSKDDPNDTGIYYEKDGQRADHYRTDIGWQAHAA